MMKRSEGTRLGGGAAGAGGRLLAGLALTFMLAQPTAAGPAGRGPAGPGSRLAPGPSILTPAAHIARSRGLTVVAGRASVQVLGDLDGLPRGRWTGGGVALPADLAGLAAVDRRGYLSTADGRLLTLDLTRPGAGGLRRLALPRPLAGPTRLAGMDDHLVLAESRAGITLIEVNPPHACGEDVSPDGPLAPVGSYPLDESFTAVAASNRLIYAATDAGEVVVLDATVPRLPTLEERIAVGGRVRALAANGRRLYVLSDEGLRILDTGVHPPGMLLHRPDITGSALSLAGRELLVGSEAGLVAWLDEDPAPQLIRITVGNNFFSPEDLVLRPGDTVSWRNLSGFHNVVSCTEYGFGCERGPAVEVFSSGPVSGPPWVFNHTFTVPGFNPYRCIPHAPFMVGTVTTEEPAPPPLEVALDIRPGSCTNPLNPGSRGVLPAAVLGTPELDVTTIDPDSLRLAGVAPLRWSLEDVGSPAETPGEGGTCQASCSGPTDGIPDLVLKFDSAGVAAAAGGDGSETCLSLELTGLLSGDGPAQEITGADAVRLRPPGRAGRR